MCVIQAANDHEPCPAVRVRHRRGRQAGGQAPGALRGSFRAIYEQQGVTILLRAVYKFARRRDGKTLVAAFRKFPKRFLLTPNPLLEGADGPRSILAGTATDATGGSPRRACSTVATLTRQKVTANYREGYESDRRPRYAGLREPATNLVCVQQSWRKKKGTTRYTTAVTRTAMSRLFMRTSISTG